MRTCPAAGRRGMERATYTTVHASISLDGLVAGPDQGLDSPLGTGGLDLHRWHVDRDQGGRVVDTAWAESLLRPRGAYLMGRNMFAPVRGPWEAREAERGPWRGADPSRPRAGRDDRRHHLPLRHRRFDAALAQARRLGDGDVHLAGGASTIRQALAAGVVDSVALDVAPVLLGAGERIFDGTATPRLTILEVAHSPYATHVRYDVG